MLFASHPHTPQWQQQKNDPLWITFTYGGIWQGFLKTPKAPFILMQHKNCNIEAVEVKDDIVWILCKHLPCLLSQQKFLLWDFELKALFGGCSLILLNKYFWNTVIYKTCASWAKLEGENYRLKWDKPATVAEICKKANSSNFILRRNVTKKYGRGGK